MIGEIIPKTLSRVYSYRLSIIDIYPITFFKIIFFPFVYLASKTGTLVASWFTPRKVEEDEEKEEQLQQMIDEIEEEGIIDSKDSELLYRSIEFKNTTAEEIMTPRVSIVGYDCTTDLNKWVKKEGVLRHSRIIVYNRYMDHIIGYMPTKLILKAMLNHEKLELSSLMLPIIAVPSTCEISNVLKLMKESHHHIAVVKDEYGGTDGILTLEDIIEELVGDLYDESEIVEMNVTPTKKRNVYLVSGTMNIDDFFDYFKLNDDFIEEDYNTLSGWINDKLGRFAEKGDNFSYGKIDVEAVKVSDYTTILAKVTYHPRRKAKIHDETE